MYPFDYPVPHTSHITLQSFTSRARQHQRRRRLRRLNKCDTFLQPCTQREECILQGEEKPGEFACLSLCQLVLQLLKRGPSDIGYRGCLLFLEESGFRDGWVYRCCGHVLRGVRCWVVFVGDRNALAVRWLPRDVCLEIIPIEGYTTQLQLSLGIQTTKTQTSIYLFQ